MTTIKHPSAILPVDVVQVIRQFAWEAEKLQELHPEQLKLIYKHNWFKLFVPGSYNGLGCTLPEVLLLEEALAWADGAVGWTVTLCAGAGWFIGFLDPEIAEAVFRTPETCLAGSGNAGGLAKKNGGQYEITGYWNYATGANLATAFTANCTIEENGKPYIKAFLFLPGEVVIRKNWHTIGMVATGSHAFAVTEISVPAKRSFIIDSRHAILPDPIYQYPFLQLAETTLAVNSSGMACRFIELCERIFGSKSIEGLLQLLENNRQQLHTARQKFYTLIEQSWKNCIGHVEIPPETLDNISMASADLANTARRVTDALYPYCGLQAADPATEINLVWRNLHTASQHSLLNKT